MGAENRAGMMETLAIVFIGLAGAVIAYAAKTRSLRLTAMERRVASLERALDAQEQVIVVEAPHPVDDGMVAP